MQSIIQKRCYKLEVYFDNSATTKPYEEVIESVCDIMRNYYGNPSSSHSLGLKAERKLRECREVFAETLNCTRDEIIFTSGGSESNNFLIRGFLKEGNNVITSMVEHPSVIKTCEELENHGIKVTYIPVDSEGRIDIDKLSESIDKNTQMISIMHVNNEIGIIQDIEKIGSIIKEKSPRAKFHVDAVQSYGKLRIDVEKAKIDLLSVSAHKIHGPRGIGFAYVRKGLYPKPLIFGGGQERGLRSGTENLAYIAGFAKAAELIYKHLDENYEKVKALKGYFIEELQKIEGARVNSPMKDEFLPHVLSVSFQGVKAEVLLHMLEDSGIYVSTGSACSSNDNHDSYVLKAVGLDIKDVKSTIRFSFNEFNTKEEVDYTIIKLKAALKFLRRIRK